MLGAGNQPLYRMRVGLEFFVSGHKDLDGMVERHSNLARGLARELGLSQRVQDAVGAAYERWDGRGWPGDLKADAIPIESRVAQLAEFIEVAHRLGGVDAAQALAKERAGAQFDPRLVGHARRACRRRSSATWTSRRRGTAVIAAEPSLRMTLTHEQADRALMGVADFVDLKSPYTLGHARAVADLDDRGRAAAGSRRERSGPARHASLVHGFGRLGVSNAIWDKPGPLAAGEWERVRHAPLSDRTHAVPVGMAGAARCSGRSAA